MDDGRQLNQDEINDLIQSLKQPQGEISDFYVCPKCWKTRPFAFEFFAKRKDKLFMASPPPLRVHTIDGCSGGGGHSFILFSDLIKSILNPRSYNLSIEQTQGFKRILESIKGVKVDYVPRAAKAFKYQTLVENMRLSLKMGEMAR
jgi:hypothetical protein